MFFAKSKDTPSGLARISSGIGHFGRDQSTGHAVDVK
jgi:hypothetical protein